MFEVIMKLSVHICFIYLVFQGFISIRNRIQGRGEYTREFKRYQKGDGFWLILSIYLLVFFRGMDLGVVWTDIGFLMTSHSYSRTYLLPFRWIRDSIEMDRFYAFLEGQTYQSNLWKEIIDNLIRLILLLIPMPLIFYRIWSGKWLGLLAAEVVTGLVLFLAYPYFVGDGILIVGLIYCICKWMESVVRKKREVSIDMKIQYGFIISLLIVSGVILIDVGSHSLSTDKITGTMEINETYALYDGLIDLNINQVEVFINRNGEENVRFLGNQEINPDLKEVFGQDIKNEVSFTYKYAYNGVTHYIGRSDWDFYDGYENEAGKTPETRYLNFESYPYSLVDKVDENTEEARFFEFFGLESIDFYVNDENVNEFAEVLSVDVGRDIYPYVAYAYKVKKIDGRVPDVLIGVSLYSDLGSVNFSKKESSVIEDHEAYQVLKVVAYTSDKDLEDEELKKADVKIYRVGKKIEGLGSESLFMLDDDEL